WKTQKASRGIPVEPYVSGKPCRKNPDVPIQGVPDINMKAKPQAQNVIPQIRVSAMPSAKILTASRERAKPASSISKPTCIQKTRKAATKTQIVLMALISGDGPSASPDA